MRGVIAALIAALFAAAPARAAGVELTWDAASSEAARANPTLASSRLGVDASRASYYAAFNRFLPSLSLSNSASESNTSRQPSYSASASASMTLFNMGDIASFRSASATLNASEAALRTASANLRSNLRQTFSDLLFAQTTLDVSRRVAEIRKRNAELVALRYESGRESKGNMLRAKAQTLSTDVQIRVAERDLRTARRDMGRQLGQEDFVEYVASGTFASAPPPLRPDDFRALLALRTDVAVSEAALRSSRASLASSNSVLFPSLSANYSRSRSGPTEFPNQRYAWSAGATLSWSIFGSGPTSAYHTTMAARRTFERAESDLAATRQSALSDLENAWAGFADAADQLRVQEALLEAARQRNEEADVRYSSGLVSFDDWELIVSDRVATERQAVAARRAAMDAETAWDRALGRALGE